MTDAPIRLGLIGDNIAASKAPALHRMASGQCDLPLSYNLLAPANLGRTFEEVLRQCRDTGYRGVNITYPYKERVVAYLQVDDPAIQAIGACNTVLFGAGRPRGFNTDHSGFMAAYRKIFRDAPPGRVALVGAGGVGRAIAFALLRLGASELRLFDLDRQKSIVLAQAICSAHVGAHIQVAETIETAVGNADGLVNATPLGMAGIGGCPIPQELIGGQRWAFDAVYTPVDTPFLLAADAAGLTTMSGYELFLYQGIDAFRIFTGFQVEERRLREQLGLGEAAAPS